MYYYLNYNPGLPVSNENGIQQATFTILQPPYSTHTSLEENNSSLTNNFNCEPLTKNIGTQTPFIFLDDDFPIDVDPIKRVADSQTRFSESADNLCMCFECDQLFQTEDSLWLHLAKDHKEGKYYLCKKCKQEFVRRLEYIEHRYHCSYYKGKRCFMCCACRKRYAIMKSLKMHKAYCPRKPFKICPDTCDICSMNKFIMEKRNIIYKIRKV